MVTAKRCMLGAVGAAALLAGTGPAPALAQAPGGQAPAGQTASGQTPAGQTAVLEEIVVTARRREESLQSAPVAITALTGAQLATRGVDTIADIDRFAPNIQFDTTSTSSGANFISVVFIRGVGQTDFLLTVEPGVATYIDGIYIARNVGAVFDVLDLDRVEVLRGPQGTLFGKNTIGGAISLTTRKPDLDGTRGKAELTVGTDDRIDVKADVSTPLSDTVAIKVAGSSRNQDGYVRFLADPDRGALGDINRDTGRVALRIRPGEMLDINLSADGTRIQENGSPAQGLAYNCPLTPPRPLCGTYNAVLGNPAVPTSLINGQYISTDPDATWIGQQTRSDLDSWGLHGTIEGEVGALTLRSFSAYRDLEAQFARDSDNTPVPFSATANDYRYTQISQEFQVLGQAVDDRLDYVVGLYFLDEDGSDRSSTNLTLVAANNLAEIDNQSYAAFGQGSFRLTDRLSATAGLRYTREEKELFLDVRRPNGAIVVPAQTVAEDFTNTSPRLGLEFQATPDLLAYASYSRGFKSGGFNIRYVNPAPAPVAFAPEKLTAYEAGVKWQGLDDRLRLNTAVFYSDYEDLQVLIRDAIATQIRNAGKAEIYGLEVEANLALTDMIGLQTALGYTKAEYEQVPPIVPPATANDQIELSDDFPKTPRWTISAGLDAAYPLGAWGELVGRVDWSYRSKVYNDAVNSELIAQPGYHLVGASIGVEAEAGWTARLFVNNLTDERYLINGQNGLASVGFAETSYSRGREYGLTLRYAF